MNLAWLKAVAQEIPRKSNNVGQQIARLVHGNRYIKICSTNMIWKAFQLVQPEPLESLFIAQPQLDFAWRTPYDHRNPFKCAPITPFEAHLNDFWSLAANRIQNVKSLASNSHTADQSIGWLWTCFCPTANWLWLSYPATFTCKVNARTQLCTNAQQTAPLTLPPTLVNKFFPC